MWNQLKKIAGDLKMTHLDEGTSGWKASNSDVTRVDEGYIETYKLRDKDRVDLVRDYKNMARTLERFEEIKESIRQNGIQERIVVAVNMDGSIEIIEGTHRLLIAEELGIEIVPVEIRYFGNSQQNPDNILI